MHTEQLLVGGRAAIPELVGSEIVERRGGPIALLFGDAGREARVAKERRGKSPETAGSKNIHDFSLYLVDRSPNIFQTLE
jgi:hypothetical protein